MDYVTYLDRIGWSIDKIVTYLVWLAKKESNAIGFYPKSNYEAALRRDRIIIAWQADHPCGFLFWSRCQGHRPGAIKINQIAIQKDAQRMTNATRLLTQLMNHEHAADRNRIILHCAEDLEANLFWRALGFVHTYTSRPRNARRREINTWEWAAVCNFGELHPITPQPTDTLLHEINQPIINDGSQTQAKEE